MPDSAAPPGPDGFQNTSVDPLRASHQLIDRILTEARAAGDPHLCQIQNLEGQGELAKLDGTGIIELVEAALVRIWRIESLGPRALDEGGVRGWNSIGWLTNLLPALFRQPIQPTGADSISNLLVRLNTRGSDVFTSLGTGLPDLAEWIERATRDLSLDIAAREALHELATRFESEPAQNSVWKKRQLRRTASALRNSLIGSGESGVVARPLPGRQISPESGEHAIEGLWIDRRIHGQGVLQHPLADRLRAAGWSFRLQGAWDPPPPPSTLADPQNAKITLLLGERDPSDLLPGGSCRWIMLEEIRITWGGTGPVPVPPEIVALLQSTVELISRPASLPWSRPLPGASS